MRSLLEPTFLLLLLLCFLHSPAMAQQPSEENPPSAQNAPSDRPSSYAADRATRLLLHAASVGNARNVRAALAAGARIDEHSEAFAGAGLQPPIVSAALAGHHEIVRILLEAGADPSIPEKDGFTVWHAAAFQGRARVLAVLLGFDVPGMGPSPSDGFWPLHRAAWCRTPRHFESVRFLIEEADHPCDVSGNDGRTPLEMARQERIRNLLEACSSVGAAARPEKVP